jgi:hypothetical protein
MTPALLAYIPLRCTFDSSRCFIPFVRVVRTMECALRQWAGGRSGVNIVRLVHEEEAGDGLHFTRARSHHEILH